MTDSSTSRPLNTADQTAEDFAHADSSGAGSAVKGSASKGSAQEKTATTRRIWITLALVLLGVTAFKLSMVNTIENLPRKGDQKMYLAGSRAIFKTGVPEYPFDAWDEAHSSPLYPYFLASLRFAFSHPEVRKNAIRTQAILSTLTALMTFIIARRCFGPRSALLSGSLVALYPTFIVYSQCFLTETVYTFFFIAVIALLMTSGEGPVTKRRALSAGLIGGLAALTKSQFVVLSPFVAVWLVAKGMGQARGQGRASILSAAMFLTGMALVVAPWSVRNTMRYGHFMMVDSNPGNVLYKNWNAVSPENHDVGLFRQWNTDIEEYDGEVPLRPRTTETNIAVRNSTEVKAAIAFVFDYPKIFLRNTWTRAQALFNPTSFFVRRLRDGIYEGLSPSWIEALVWITVLSTAFALAFGVLGLTTHRRTVDSLLPVLMILACTGLSVLIISTSRYRFPMMPLVIMFAIEGCRLLPRTLRTRPRGLLLGVPLLAIVALSFIRYAPYSF